MRKFRWPLIALAFLVLLGFAFAMRRQKNALDALKPFVIAEDLSYEDLRFVSLGSSKSGVKGPDASAVENRVLYIKGIDQEALLKILRARTSQIHALEERSGGVPLVFLAAPANPDFTSLHAFRGPFAVSFQGPPPRTEFTIVEHLSLSHWDVTWLRIRALGQDPFKTSKRTFTHPTQL
jgi:hypothetical protein